MIRFLLLIIWGWSHGVLTQGGDQPLERDQHAALMSVYDGIGVLLVDNCACS
jgi:hypothetical protein